MKKIVALVLVLALMVPFVCAAAEPYVFYNGVRWGLTVDEVKACEEGEGTFYEDGSTSSLFYNDVKLSKFTAVKGYLFADDSLFCVEYYNFPNDDKSLTYLQKAISSLYGDAAELTVDEILAFALCLDNQATANDFEPGYQWHAGDDAVIWMFTAHGTTGIIYLNTEFDPATIGVYDTTGL